MGAVNIASSFPGFLSILPEYATASRRRCAEVALFWVQEWRSVLNMPHHINPLKKIREQIWRWLGVYLHYAAAF